MNCLYCDGPVSCVVCDEPADGVAAGAPVCDACGEGKVIRPGLEIRVDDSMASFVGIAGRYQSGQWKVRVLTDDGRVREVHAARIGLVRP
jgi:hypothetical protein